MFTILLVDDDVMSLAILATQLLQVKNRGFHVAMATTPSEALEIMNESVKLVISDLYMPGMNGIDLIKAIKHKYSDIKAILISASDTLEDTDSSKIDLSIRKPFHLDDLTSIVELSSKTNFDAVLDRITLDIAHIKNSLEH